MVISIWTDIDQGRSPEDQDHSLGLYSLPFSLLESTFVAKLLYLFHFTTVSELWIALSHVLTE